MDKIEKIGLLRAEISGLNDDLQETVHGSAENRMISDLILAKQKELSALVDDAITPKPYLQHLTPAYTVVNPEDDCC